MQQSNKLRKSALFILYIIGFIFAMRTALPSYMSSTFISGITAEDFVGIIYTISSLLTIIAFILIPKVINRFGNYKTVLGLVGINILSLAGLSFLSNPILIIGCFVFNIISSIITAFCLDLFIEHYSKDTETGRIRSFYLTSVNLAWLASPFLAGLILAGTQYSKVFFASMSLMIVVLVLIAYNMKGFRRSEYPRFSILNTLVEVNKNKNIKAIISANFLLQLFYCLMVIYTPIYLFKYVGFDWVSIGLIFTIMLTPFIFILIPLGWLADTKIGEKELLTIGFIIIAVSTGFISFVASTSIVVWGLILFTTRIGASMVEIMSETYFFKKIGPENMNIIDLYRMMSSFAYVIGPIIATTFLIFFDIKYIFLMIGFIMFFGIRFSLGIEDTR